MIRADQMSENIGVFADEPIGFDDTRVESLAAPEGQ